MIKIKNLDKYYNKGKTNEVHVINNASIEFPDKGLICILGESGSGKTTLMNTVSGLDDFSGGSIEIDGDKINHYGSRKQEQIRNEKFGYIFQNYYMLKDRSVEHNLMLAMGVYDISDEEKSERIDYVLKAVDMWKYKKRHISKLSGGQQQRIAIARALIKSPRVIFADEPTGNLDEANTFKIMSILKKISENCLVIVVTHEKSIADFFADRIVTISDGKIIDDKEKKEHSTYSYSEDSNIYLCEYKKRQSGDENGIEIFDKGENKKLDIRLVVDGDKIYIETKNANNIEIISPDSEKKIMEGNRSKIELSDAMHMEYSVEPIENTKKSGLGIKEIKDIAASNLAAMGKKKYFLSATLFALAVLVVFSIQRIASIVTIEEGKVVNTDKNIVEVSLEKSEYINVSDYLNAKSALVEHIENNDKDLYNKIIINPETQLAFSYEGFTQLKNVQAMITDFSFVPIEKLDTSKLIYGRMAQNENEVVVDKWVIERFLENSYEISNVIDDVSFFVGKNIVALNGTSLLITGISETEQMDIYIHNETIMNLDMDVTKYMKFSDYIENVNRNYKGKTLGIGEDGKYEILVSQSEFEANYSVFAKQEYFKMELYEDALYMCEYENNVLSDLEIELDMSKENGDEEMYAEVLVMYNNVKATLAEYEKTRDEAFEQMCSEYNVGSYEECKAKSEDSEGFTFTYRTNSGTEYTAVGYFSIDDQDHMIEEIVVSDEAEKYMPRDILARSSSFYIYGVSAKDVDKYMKALPIEIRENLNISVKNPALDALFRYSENIKENIKEILVITAVIFILSMFMLYFMMKANMVHRISDIGVYRLIGISKGSIAGIFAVENTILTFFSSVAGALICTLITIVVSKIPSLELELSYPWISFCITVVLLFISNIFFGILPIRKLLKLPPAKLAAKYDI